MHFWVGQNSAHLAVTPGASAASLWLDANDGVTVSNSGNHNFTVVDHGGRHVVFLFAWRHPPGITHFFPGISRQSFEPGLVFIFAYHGQSAAQAHDLLHWGPPELGDRLACHYCIDQLLAVLGSVLYGVARVFHALEDAGHALQRIQVRT
ncbi:Uncharacterised protein [uncultured archaeon]|nr:Uncharacterised protein [uncultured archaeon]